MSKKPEKKLIDVAKFLRKAQDKSRKFVQHKILSQSKALLLIGGDSNLYFKNQLIQKFSKTWKIANIGQTPVDCDVHIPFSKFDKPSLQEIEKQVSSFNKYYECVILMPEHHSKFNKSIKDEEFLDDIYCETPSKLQHALLSYKLASHHLTSSGVVMLSGSQKSFFADKNLPVGLQVNNGQLFGVNILVGERDHVDIDSTGFVPLIQDLDLTEPVQKEKEGDVERVIELFRMWSEGRGLPFPGSFAKMIRKDNTVYPEFY